MPDDRAPPTRPRRLARIWAGYRSAAMPPDASATQLIETEQAFYAGATAYYTLLMQQLEPGDDATHNDMALMDDLVAELEEFGTRFDKKMGVKLQ